MDEISKNTWNESWWKFSSEKFFSAEHNMEIQNLKRRNAEHALFESQRELEHQRWQILEANQLADQAQRETIHLRSDLKMKNRFHQESYARSCQKNWRIEKKLLSREHTEKQQRLEESSVQHDQESRTVSLLSETKYEDYKNYWYFWRFENLPWSGLTEQLWRTCVPHQALITSSSRKPSRDIGMLRNTREDMSIPGNVFGCQHARRDPDELRDDSRNLATLLGILRTEGIEKSESGEPLQSTPLSCSSNVQTKSLNGGKCPMFMTNRAVGIGTCVQGMTIPSYLSSKMHLQKFPDQTKFQSWIVNFRVEVCAKARNQWKGANSYTERKTGVCFQRKTIGFCSNVDTCNFLHTHATGRREKEVGDVKKSHLEQVSSSVPKVKEQTDVKKLKQSKGQSCDLR